jgi:hypothetical protein
MMEPHAGCDAGNSKDRAFTFSFNALSTSVSTFSRQQPDILHANSSFNPNNRKERKMSQKIGILKASIPQAGAQNVIRGKFPIFVIFVSMLALITVALFVTMPKWLPAVEKAEANFSLAANPELMLVRRYAGSLATSSKASLLAVNPELAVARRYTGSVVKRMDVSFLATNPELMLASRYAGPAVQGAGVSFLAANPELAIAGRHITQRAQAEETALLSANPEVQAFRRYATSRPQWTDSELYARNPELKVSHRLATEQSKQ